MKATKVLFVMFGLAIILLSFIKDNSSSDARDKFIGTWKGEGTISVTSVIDNTDTISHVISKSTVNANQIIISTPGSGSVQTASVEGNTYTYETYTETRTINGITITGEFTGSGTISGNTINESGNVQLTLANITYPGTWTSTLTRN
jgi:hypothetical protein